MKTVLADVRTQKDKIIKNRQQSFIQAKASALNNYKIDLLKTCEILLIDIKNGDIDKLDSESRVLENIKEKLSDSLNEAYEDLARQLYRDTEKGLKNVLNNAYNEFNKTKGNATGERTGSYREEKSGFFSWCGRKTGLGGYETVHYSEKTVITTQVYRAVESFFYEIGRDISNKAEDIKESWRKELFRKLVDEYRKIVGDKDADEKRIRETLKTITQEIILSDFRQNTEIPKDLVPRGTLAGYNAEDYLGKATTFIGTQEQKIKREVEDNVDRLKKHLGGKDIANNFFAVYDEKINILKKQIINKRENIDRLTRLMDQLQQETVVND